LGLYTQKSRTSYTPETDMPIRLSLMALVFWGWHSLNWVYHTNMRLQTMPCSTQCDSVANWWYSVKYSSCQHHPDTVPGHLKNTYTKLQVNSGKEAVAKALRH